METISELIDRLELLEKRVQKLENTRDSGIAHTLSNELKVYGIQ